MGITLWQSLSDDAVEMARVALKDVKTLAEWKKIRPRRHQEFMRSIGLDPLPERCDLKVTEYGELKGNGFRARKIGFQILPDCWNSACIYYPDPLPAGKAPGVLYVCGHSAIGTYTYQYHPIMWARRGYVCLIVDTIEQNDNPGEHHGAIMNRHDRWLAMGYTPAGAEVWNAMRALDILASDPKVDPERLGVTGVSGGGACSFHTAVADDRLKAVSTLCGVSSPLDAIRNRHVMGHCDCMYPHNVYHKDISDYAALLAPRAALFCIADHDPIFHPGESRALVERTKPVFALYGHEDHCAWLACPGPHGDHPEFDEGTQRWFDRHVAGDERPLLERGARELEERDTNVFKGCPPAPNRLDLLPQLLSPQGTLPLPQTADEWPAVRQRALETLRAQVPGLSARGYRQASFELDGDWQWVGGKAPVLNRMHRGQIDGVEIAMQMVVYSNTRKKLVLGVGNEGHFAMHAMCRTACSIDSQSVVYGGFEPRLAGVNAPASEPYSFPPGARLAPVRSYMTRIMALTGQTPVMMTFHDIGVLVDYVTGLEETKGFEIYLHGRGEAGVAALYRGIMDERIAGVIAEDAPSSHLDGAPILGVLRAFDMPQAVGLMAPRKLALVTAGHNNWNWATRVYERLGCRENLIMTDDLRSAMTRILA
jgi:cephalosporin-C deacetylase-like acetyl esterase